MSSNPLFYAISAISTGARSFLGLEYATAATVTQVWALLARKEYGAKTPRRRQQTERAAIQHLLQLSFGGAFGLPIAPQNRGQL